MWDARRRSITTRRGSVRNQRFNSIRGRIFGTIFGVMILTILVSIFMTYFYFAERLKQSQIKDDQAFLMNIAGGIDGEFQEIIDYQKNILIEDEIQEYMYKCSRNPDLLKYADKISAEKQLKKFILLRDSIIVDIGLTDVDGNLITNDEYYGAIRKQKWYRPFCEEVVSGVSAVHTVMRSKGHDYVDVVTFVTRSNYIYETKTYIGNVLIHMNLQELTEPLQNMTESLENIVIFNETGDLIYAVKGEEHSGTFQKLSAHKGKGLVEDAENYYLISEIPNPGWTMVGILPQITVSQNMWSIMFIFIILILLGVCMLCLIIIPMTRSITVPLTQLSVGIKKVAEGDLETRVTVNSADEIGIMTERFNQMVMDIKRLLKENVDKEKQERAIEMKLLMTEINPHFIYNTLDTVIYLGRRAGASDVVRVTRLFISILQYNIRIQPYHRVCIQEEENYIRNYLEILSYRYNYQIRLLWECEEGLSACLIHQMLIYPLVENSVYHGIMPKCADGSVCVKIQEENGRLEVTVQDDGVGMSRERQKALESHLAEEGGQYSGDHIGLKNVNMRLKLLYGNDYSLQLDSIEGQGTKFAFYLPKMNEQA